MTDGSEERNESGGEVAAPENGPGDSRQDTFLLDGEKAIDVILGAAVVTAETIMQAAKRMQENGPACLDALETKGRPVRERIVEALRSGRTTPLREAAFTPPASAEEEISALEQRVRELEQQIASSATNETPAEGATYTPQETWGETVPSLAESPYAISETEEERAQEEKLGEDSGRGDSP
jgi:hypothetical protein